MEWRLVIVLEELKLLLHCVYIQVGQSVVIAASIIIFNMVELAGDHWREYLLSLYIIIPFTAVSMALIGKIYCIQHKSLATGYASTSFFPRYRIPGKFGELLKSTKYFYPVQVCVDKFNKFFCCQIYIMAN